jgi:UDP-N-acetylmuramoylalanine-D-glutamate ligase
MVKTETQDLGRIEESLNQLTAHVVALTAVVGGIVTAAAVDYERLEECVNFAADRLRPGARPVLLAKAAAVLEGFEKMQKVLQIESRKKLGLKKPTPKR